MDAALFKTQGAAGIGVVARNSEGVVVAWRQKRIQHLICPETAEALAVLEGVRLTGQLGWQKVSIESNCLSIIKAINSTEVCLLAAGHLIDEIKGLSSSFSVISFDHAYRTANFEAHFLAKSADRDLEGTQLPSFFV